MKLVDLTIPWGTQIQPLEGHPHISFEPITTHEREHRSNTRVLFSIHTGTHIDAPYHFYADGEGIDQVPLDVLSGPTRLCDLRQVAGAGVTITRQLIEGTGLTSDSLADHRILLWAGWAQDRWSSPRLYENNPHLDPDAARWLRDSGVRAVALDFPIDRADPYPCHQVLLGARIPLIENLINIDRIGRSTFTLLAFPLPVVHGDGGPARVAALLD